MTTTWHQTDTSAQPGSINVVPICWSPSPRTAQPSGIQNDVENGTSSERWCFNLTFYMPFSSTLLLFGRLDTWFNWTRWKSPNSCVCTGPCSRALHIVRNLLGKNESQDSCLFCCWLNRKSIYIFEVLALSLYFGTLCWMFVSLFPRPITFTRCLSRGQTKK